MVLGSPQGVDPVIGNSDAVTETEMKLTKPTMATNKFFIFCFLRCAHLPTESERGFDHSEFTSDIISFYDEKVNNEKRP